MRDRLPRPWYARTEARLASVVLAILLVAAGAAVQRAREPRSPGVGFTAQAATPTATGTAAASPTAEPTLAATPANASPPPASPSPVPTPTSPPPASPSPAPTPAATPTPTPLLIDLRPAEVGPGEAMLVWVQAPGAVSVTLEFRGAAYTLLPDGGIFWGVVGLPLDAALGPDTLTISAHSSAGELLESALTAYEVIALDRPVDYIELTPDQASVLTAEAGEQERELRAQQFAQFDSGRRWNTLFERPAIAPMTSEFGRGRSYNGAPVTSFHSGLDFGAEEGSAVGAAAPGRVDWVGEMPIRGVSVIVDHGAGVKTGYHHLQSAAVTVGQHVQAGDQIGAVGESGLATGPHLHWELTVWGVNVDPLTWTIVDFTP